MEGSYNEAHDVEIGRSILPSRKMEGSYNAGAVRVYADLFYHLGKWKGAITRSASAC